MASARFEMVDVKKGLRELGKIDAEFRKEVRQDAERIAKPAIDEVKAQYTMVPLSGMAYRWDDTRGRQNQLNRTVFPFKVNKARSGVRFRFDTRRNALGVIKIEQRDRATAVFETAGRKNSNKLGDQLNLYTNRGWKSVPTKPTRIIGPATYKAARKGVTDELRALIVRVNQRLERRF